MSAKLSPGRIQPDPGRVLSTPGGHTGSWTLPFPIPGLASPSLGLHLHPLHSTTPVTGQMLCADPQLVGALRTQ